MARVRPAGMVSDWLQSVAEVLPLPHRTPRPYTLGEAVAELCDYVRASDASKWNSGSSTSHRASLRAEIKAQSEAVGGRLSTLVAPLLQDLSLDGTQEAIIAAAEQFKEIWHSEVAIAEGLCDLCAAAKVLGKTSDALRKVAAIVASQVGPAAHGPFSLLSSAADALVSTEEQLAWQRDVQLTEPLTEERRLELAREILVAPPVGQVVVWTVYSRALPSGMREVIGPMTFLRADWALPNTFEHKWHDFPEREELRDLRENIRWLDDLHSEALKRENRLTLVRVELGERQVAGAAEEARRRIEALVSIAVEAGGVSWLNAGATAVLLNGKALSSSGGDHCSPDSDGRR